MQMLYDNEETTSTDNNANFASHIESRMRRKSETRSGERPLQPPATNDAAFVVVAWAGRRLSHPTSLSASRFDVSTTSIKVKGDVTGLTASGERYWIYPPPHIETEHGTIDPDALCYSSKYLWAGYEYVTPMAGFYVDPPGASGLGVYGRQDGSNQAGWYYCWNRTYDSSTARWTTPDPAASPWTNIWSYCGTNPISGTDPSGLSDCALSIYTHQSKDGSESEVTGLASYDCEARSASDFSKCVSNFLADSGCKCISKLVVIGHGSSLLGGRDEVRDLSVADRQALRDAMCDDASVEIRKCGSYNNVLEMDLITVLLGGRASLSERGQGWDGDCVPMGFRHIFDPTARKRNWWAPSDAGVTDDDLDAVRYLNKWIDWAFDSHRDLLEGYHVQLHKRVKNGHYNRGGVEKAKEDFRVMKKIYDEWLKNAKAQIWKNYRELRAQKKKNRKEMESSE